MALFNRFPFSNIHELNLDWIMRVWNTLRGGSTNQVLAKRSNADFDFKWVSGGGGGGTDDYNDLNNKPQINGNTLTGNKTASQLGISIPSASNATPQPLGTAAAGSSTDYSRADHVHKKPTASDLGITVPVASTTTPQPLGTAAAGSSTNYSRADHVHAKPTAADIGAAPAWTKVTNSSTGAVTQAMSQNTFYSFTGVLTSLTITLADGSDKHYHFMFISDSPAPVLNMPNSVTMPDNFTVAADTTYEVDIFEGFAVIASWSNA